MIHPGQYSGAAVRCVFFIDDKGIDFDINGYKIDVKTARKPYNLLVKEEEIRGSLADIYVLARFVPPCAVDLIGWETKEVMKLLSPLMQTASSKSFHQSSPRK
jgi:hypothetical protein